jgi:hypothetical protein
MRQVLKRSFGLAKVNLEPADEEPCGRQVRIECERSIDEDPAGVKVVRNVCERISAVGKCEPIALRASLTAPDTKPSSSSRLGPGHTCAAAN